MPSVAHRAPAGKALQRPPALRRWRPPVLLATHIALTVVAAVVGFGSVDAFGLSVIWPLQAVLLFVLITQELLAGMTAEGHRVTVRDVAAVTRNVGATGLRTPALGVLLLAVFVVVAMAMGASPLWAVFAFLVNMAGALTTVVFYRVVASGRCWLPGTLREAMWLVVAIDVGGAVTGQLGAYPGLDSFAPDELLAARVLSSARLVAVVVTVVTCLLPWCYEVTQAELEQRRTTWSWLLPMLPVTIACAWLPAMSPPGIPLAWLYVVPALLAGIMLSRRQGAVVVVLFQIALCFPPNADFAADGSREMTMLVTTNVTLTACFAGALAMVLAMFRESLANGRAAVAERVQAEREQSLLFSGVLQSMTDGVVLSDDEGRVRLANSAAPAIAGGPLPARLTAEWPPGALDIEDADTGESGPPLLILQRRRERAAGHAVTVECGVPGEAGERRLALTAHEVPATLPTDPAVVLLLLRDMTSSYRRRQELESFAGTVAQDLREPVGVMRGWLDNAVAALDRNETGRAEESLDRAMGSVDRMRGLIDDYLAYAVSRGGVLRLEELSLLDLALDIVGVYDDTPRVPVFDLDLGDFVHADLALTRQLFANLVTYGVHRCPPGSRPRVTLVSRPADPGWVEVSMQHGVAGEMAAAAPAADAALTQPVESAGLALAICEAIVQRHGGVLSEECHPGGSTTFRFTLPAGGVL